MLQNAHSSEASTSPKWSPSGDLIAYLQDVGGDENYQIYVMSTDGGEPRDVTGAPGYLHENYDWSWDGTRVTYVSNRDRQFDVYCVARAIRSLRSLSWQESPRGTRM